MGETDLPNDGETNVKDLTAKDIMTSDVISVREDWTLSELAATLSGHMITGAPVVDDTGRLLGVVSATDIARHNVTRSMKENVPPDFYVRGWDMISDDTHSFSVEEESEQTVRDIMTSVIFSVSERATLAEMADTMIGGRVHRLIVTEGDKVLGIVTTLDILKVVRDQARTA